MVDKVVEEYQRRNLVNTNSNIDFRSNTPKNITKNISGNFTESFNYCLNICYFAISYCNTMYVKHLLILYI